MDSKDAQQYKVAYVTTHDVAKNDSSAHQRKAQEKLDEIGPVSDLQIEHSVSICPSPSKVARQTRCTPHCCVTAEGLCHIGSSFTRTATTKA